MLERLREAYAPVEGRVAPFYGLAAALAVAIPLLTGSLTGHEPQASIIALGAYLVALRAPEGPYGARARNLASAVLIITLGAMLGGNLSGHDWLAVAVVPLIVGLGNAVNWIGPTAGLAVLLTAVRPAGDVVHNGLLELVGGLFACALLLAPWPVRRLRPLRGTLAEAAAAVAEALDAVAEDIGRPDASVLEAVELDDPELAEVTRKPDWEESRRAASQALTAARATYDFYRSGRQRREPTRPERLIDSLARIMQETVALRSAIEAARRRPPERGWEEEGKIAVAALAARVRLVAGAVARTREAPLGTAESAAIRRLGRKSEEIRRAGLAGDEDLVAVALIGQIRRSVERIAGSVDAARRVAAGGIRIGFGPPRLIPADATGPSSTWEQLGRAVRNRTPGFRRVGRIVFVAVLAMALTAALKLPHGHWMVLTAMMSLRGTYGETINNVVQRVGGTAVGSAIAAVLLTLTPDHTATAIVIFFIALVGFALRSLNFSYWALFGTPLAMMLLDFSVPSDWTDAGGRIALTLAGGLMAFLAVRLLWPAGHTERLPRQLGRLLGVHAKLIRTTAAVVDGREERLPLEELADAEREAESIAETITQLGHERLPDLERIDRLGTIADSAHRVRDHLIAIGRMVREEEVDAGPLPEILDRLADSLEEAADAIDDPGPPEEDTDAPSPGERLDEEFTALDTHLSALARRRRAEIRQGVGADEFTPLRHALLQASSTRYAARSLRGDTETLIESSQKVLGA
ncbi:FUSC family protein [Spirillospora sp. NPDC029432]|uniref:FUSC family protein n=1 Tax=Spirillospora sp. NPDC029432 TaxID=3154599 RepID=UPI00345269EC